MNWDAFGALAEALGAAAVIATLAYLSVQIRQNSRMMRAQIRDSISGKQMMLSSLPSTNPALAQTLAKTNPIDVSGFSGTAAQAIEGWEAWTLNGMYLVVFREWENSHYQFTQGLFEPRDFAVRRRMWELTMASETFRVAWRQYRETFSPDFRTVMDEIVGHHVDSD